MKLTKKISEQNSKKFKSYNFRKNLNAYFAASQESLSSGFQTMSYTNRAVQPKEWLEA